MVPLFWHWCIAELYTLYNGSEDLALTGTIPANSSYLIAGAVKTTADDKLTYDLPTADLTCDWVYEFLDTKAILVMPHWDMHLSSLVPLWQILRPRHSHLLPWWRNCRIILIYKLYLKALTIKIDWVAFLVFIFWNYAEKTNNTTSKQQLIM